MLSSKIRKRLNTQGFACSAGSFEWVFQRWLRFTPALSTIWIATGTILASPILLWTFAAISLFGASNRHHLFDYVFNFGVGRWRQVPTLPENPAPRRFAMFLAGIWGSSVGVLFFFGFMKTGYIFGGLLAFAGAVVASTHFCLGSWLYQVCSRFVVKQGDEMD